MQSEINDVMVFLWRNQPQRIENDQQDEVDNEKIPECLQEKIVPLLLIGQAAVKWNNEDQ